MKKHGRTILIALLTGIYMAFCYEVGGRIGADGADRLGNLEILIRMLLKTFFYGAVVFLSWMELPKLYRRLRERRGFTRIRAFLDKAEGFRLPFWGCMLIFSVLWLPVFLGIFPGAFAYDAPTQWQQFRHWQIDTHHPVLHTLLIGLCLEGIGSFTSYNMGLAIYTILQMAAMAAVFSYAVSFMRRYRVPMLLRGFAVLFWGLSPVVHLFVVSTTKDTLFSGVLLLFLLSLIDYGCDREGFLKSRRRKALFLLSAVGTMILRNNGFYIAVVILMILCLYRVGRRKMLAMIVGILAFYLVYTGPVYRLLGVEKGELGEMFSVPLQQMARTYVLAGGEEGDVALLEALVPREDLLNYVPTLADVVKRNFREDVFRKNWRAYLKLWIKWGIQNPGIYIQSFLINTSDYWYPKAVVDGYNPGTERTDYNRYSVGAPAKRVEMLPEVHEFYRSLSEDRSASVKPLMFLLISPGWYLLMIVYLCAGFWNNRRREFFLCCTGIMLTVATALLGPVAQVRYVLILFFVFPVMLGFFFTARPGAKE